MQNTSVSRVLAAIGRRSRNLTVFPVMWLSIIAAGSQLTAGQHEQQQQQRQQQQQQQAGEEEPTRGGPLEGIKVHGHWVIDVRNPDRSLVSHTEFENAFIRDNGAPDFLARVLAHQSSVGFWYISLRSDAGTPPCVHGAACTLFESNNLKLSADGANFPTLTLSASAGQFTLAGTATVTATQNATIDNVFTLFDSCGLTLDPSSSCPSEVRQTRFSGRFLNPIVNVAPGQLVQVTVTISFS